MKNLKELEKEYEELGREIEKLKKEQERENDIYEDPIFLLSVKEYEKYKDKIPHINCWWWLRSPSDYFNHATCVDNDGFVRCLGDSVDDNGVAVRPVLKISNLKSFLKSFEAIKVDVMSIFLCGITWVKIDEDLYIAEVPISFRRFNRRFDEKLNDYNTSEIRKFLLDWYENRKDW